MEVPEPYGLPGNPSGKCIEWSLEKLEDAFPSIHWREPMPMGTLKGGDFGLGCRVCIARHGIVGFNISKLPKTVPEFREHWQKYHDEKTDS